jgi:hypothetical protein
MTPKEKAQELVDKFNYESKHYLMLDAKQCALIAVIEILNLLPLANRNFWRQVKHEIENL